MSALRMHRIRWHALGLLCLMTLLLVIPTTVSAPKAVASDPTNWLATFSLGQDGFSSDVNTNVYSGCPVFNGTGMEFQDQTVRDMVRLAAGGPYLRIHLQNLSNKPAILDEVDVALADPSDTLNDTPAIQSRTSTPVLFPSKLSALGQSSSSTAIIPPASQLTGQPGELISFPVGSPAGVNSWPAGQELVISIFMQTRVDATYHTYDPDNSYFTPADSGNHAQDASGAWFTRTNAWADQYGQNQWLWGRSPIEDFISSVDVSGDTQLPAVVALGDSTTDGAGLQPGMYQRWTDDLQNALGASPSASIVNEGLGGNRLNGLPMALPTYQCSGVGPPGVNRFSWDVLAKAGVKTVVLDLGLNDLLGADTPMDLENGLVNLAQQAHQSGLHVIVATLVPLDQCVSQSEYDNNLIPKNAGDPAPAGCAFELYRHEVNTWITTGTDSCTSPCNPNPVNPWTDGNFDCYVDFATLVQQASYPNLLKPADAITIDAFAQIPHPNAQGYSDMEAAFGSNPGSRLLPTGNGSPRSC